VTSYVSEPMASFSQKSSTGSVLALIILRTQWQAVIAVVVFSKLNTAGLWHVVRR